MERISGEALDFWMDAWTDGLGDNRATRVRDFSGALVALAIVDTGEAEGVVARLVRQACAGRSAAERLAAFDGLLIMAEEMLTPQGVLPALQDGLSSTENLVRAKASALVLAMLDRGVSHASLASALLDSSRSFPLVTTDFTDGQLLGPSSLKSLSILCRQATGEQAHILANALVLAALGRLPGAVSDKYIVDTLRQALTGPVWAAGMAAGDALAWMGQTEGVLAQLENGCSDPSEAKRLEAVRGLSRMYTATYRTPAVLLRLLHSPDVAMRANVVDALGQTLGACGETAREELFEVSEDPLIEQLAVHSLQRMRARWDREQSVVKCLRDAVTPKYFANSYESAGLTQTEEKSEKKELTAICLYVQLLLPRQSSLHAQTHAAFDDVLRELLPSLSVYSCAREELVAKILLNESAERAIGKGHALARRLREAKVPVQMAVHAGPLRLRRENGVWKLAGAADTVTSAILPLGDTGYILVSQAVAMRVPRQSAEFAWLEDIGTHSVPKQSALRLYTLFDPQTGTGKAGLPAPLKGATREAARVSHGERLSRLLYRLAAAIAIATVGLGCWAAVKNGSPIWASIQSALSRVQALFTSSASEPPPKARDGSQPNEVRAGMTEPSRPFPGAGSNNKSGRGKPHVERPQPPEPEDGGVIVPSDGGDPPVPPDGTVPNGSDPPDVPKPTSTSGDGKEPPKTPGNAPQAPAAPAVAGSDPNDKSDTLDKSGPGKGTAAQQPAQPAPPK